MHSHFDLLNDAFAIRDPNVFKRFTSVLQLLKHSGWTCRIARRSLAEHVRGASRYY